jgi:hypothetical protein
LAYFTDYPVLRLEEYYFCEQCSDDQRVAAAKKIEVKTDLKLLATLAGWQVYDLSYHIKGERFDPKLILVKTGADQYREIYHCEPYGGQPGAYVTKIGNQQFLEARNPSGGRQIDDYAYFSFDKHGPTLVDFRPIIIAAKSIKLPPGRTIPPFGSDLKYAGTHYLWHSIQPLRVGFQVTEEVGVQVRAQGTIWIDFRFSGGRVIPTKTQYDPNPWKEPDQQP